MSRSPQSHENGQQQLQQYHESGDNDSQNHQGGEGAPSQSSTLTYDPLLLGMDVVIKDDSSTDINGGV